MWSTEMPTRFSNYVLRKLYRIMLPIHERVIDIMSGDKMEGNLDVKL